MKYLFAVLLILLYEISFYSADASDFGFKQDDAECSYAVRFPFNANNFTCDSMESFFDDNKPLKPKTKDALATFFMEYHSPHVVVKCQYKDGHCTEHDSISNCVHDAIVANSVQVNLPPNVADYLLEKVVKCITGTAIKELGHVRHRKHADSHHETTGMPAKDKKKSLTSGEVAMFVIIGIGGAVLLLAICIATIYLCRLSKRRKERKARLLRRDQFEENKQKDPECTIYGVTNELAFGKEIIPIYTPEEMAERLKDDPGVSTMSKDERPLPAPVETPSSTPEVVTPVAGAGEQIPPTPPAAAVAAAPSPTPSTTPTGGATPSVGSPKRSEIRPPSPPTLTKGPHKLSQLKLAKLMKSKSRDRRSMIFPLSKSPGKSREPVPKIRTGASAESPAAAKTPTGNATPTGNTPPKPLAPNANATPTGNTPPKAAAVAGGPARKSQESKGPAAAAATPPPPAGTVPATTPPPPPAGPARKEPTVAPPVPNRPRSDETKGPAAGVAVNPKPPGPPPPAAAAPRVKDSTKTAR